MSNLISKKNNIIRLETKDTTYIIKIGKYNYLEHVYYGAKIHEDECVESIKPNCYNDDDRWEAYNEAQSVPFEWSDFGRGDFRDPAAIIKMPDGSYNGNYTLVNTKIVDDLIYPKTLPSPYKNQDDEVSTLQLTLKDRVHDVYLHLYYCVFFQHNIITRWVKYENKTGKNLKIERLLSSTFDMLNRDYQITTFDGSWGRETNINKRPVSQGVFINSSTVGASSAYHNPGFMISENNTNETYGNVYGFNLVYSGNHYASIELNQNDMVRITQGINPLTFEWFENEFETPVAILSFSNNGFNGLSANFHNFVNNNIVRGDWKNKPRPILSNSWEAYYFDFDEDKIVKAAKKAKECGIELFVLDDGWFGDRNGDNAGLGDYDVNLKKLPNGMSGLSAKIHDLGLKFGLWFEPEMINEDSKLYRKHPDWAIQTPNKRPVLGRNQLTLDITRDEVQEYIVENIVKIIDEANIDYIKWDYNRQISDAFSTGLTTEKQGEFYHRYILGLYKILDAIFTKRPHILHESCSSGGNRFDLGMLCFSQQIWASDNVDPIARLSIQKGLSYLYPISTIGAHVGGDLSGVNTRQHELSTRFNVSAFGAFGYEFDLLKLKPNQQKEVINQVEFYKKHRELFQFGTFLRNDLLKTNREQFTVVSKNKKNSISVLYNTIALPCEKDDVLHINGLDSNLKYQIKNISQGVLLSRYLGHTDILLENDFVEKNLNEDLFSTKERDFIAYGNTLSNVGIMLKGISVLGENNKESWINIDFSSRLFLISEKGL